MSKQSKELRGATLQELQPKLLELRKELIKLNAQVATGTQLKNPGQLRVVKKNIARILTEMTAKEKSAPKTQIKPKEVKKK